VKKRIAIYPGTFDPITNGHLDITKRASELFDEIIIAVSTNIQKSPLFTLEERKSLIESTVKDLDNVVVHSFNDLAVRYAHEQGARILIRGIRAVSDFEYEFQMALMNRKLAPDIETVYLMPSEEYTYINSSIVKEVAKFGGKIESFLPVEVAQAVKDKVKQTLRSV